MFTTYFESCGLMLDTNVTVSCSVPAARPLQMLLSTVTRAPGLTAPPPTLPVLSQSLPTLQTAPPILSQHRPPGQSRGWIPSPPGLDWGRRPRRVDSLLSGLWTLSTASLLAPRLSPPPFPRQIPPEVLRGAGHPQGWPTGWPHPLTPPGGLPLTYLRCH